MKEKGCLTRCFSSKTALHISILFLHHAAFHNRFLKRACHRVLRRSGSLHGYGSILCPAFSLKFQAHCLFSF
jgi:hypothetical protein